MTKLNLKELREDCESDKNCEFKDDRIINFKTIMPLLDWIERMRSFLPGILCELDNGAPTDRNIALAKLLAELEEA